MHKEVVRKRIGSKLYKKHAMLYLFGGLVSSFLHENENIMYYKIHA